MASKQLAKSLTRSALTAALGLCFVGGAYAQSNAAGAVTGNADPGDTITISNPATGFSRPVTVGADGHYRFRSEARRVGKECVSTCRSRWAPATETKKKK